MNFTFLILSVLVLGASSFAETPQESFEKVIRDDAVLEARHFSSKLVKGKLDKKGYGPMREVVGPLSPLQSFEPGEAVMISKNYVYYNQEYSERTYSIPVFKVTKNSIVEAKLSFTTLIQCNVERWKRTGKFGRYEWRPTCFVNQVMMP